MNRLAFAVLAMLHATSLPAQDLRRLAPQSPPPVQAPADRPAPSAAASVSEDAILLPRLNGLVFLARPEQVAEPAHLDEHKLDMQRVPFLQRADFAERVRSWIDRPLSRRDLDRLLAAINLYYAGHDRPFVHVSAPRQDVTEGVLRVLVVEGRLERIEVTGARHFDEAYYRRAFGLAPGAPLEKSRIDAGLDWIARSNPFHAASVAAAPGSAFGTTDLELRVYERQPWRVYAGANNTGTDTTANERLMFGGNWGNAFGLGHQLSAQLTASPDLDKSLGLSAQYVMPLPWRHLLRVSAAASLVNADVPEGFDSDGKSWQVSTSYEVPLASVGALRHSVQLGMDFKRSDNNLEFGGIPVTDNVTDVAQAGLGWRGSLPDAYGETHVDVRVVYSPGKFGAHNDDEAFAGSRWGSKAAYSYGRMSLQRHTPLPAGFAWRISVTWQQSSENLLGSEQLGLSGTYGVRGYRESDLYADEGLLVRNELLLPAFGVLSRAGGTLTDQLQLIAFSDYGRGNSRHRMSGERDHLDLSSAGLRAQYALGDSLSAVAEYGWQLKALPGQSKGGRAHLGLMMSY